MGDIWLFYCQKKKLTKKKCAIKTKQTHTKNKLDTVSLTQQNDTYTYTHTQTHKGVENFGEEPGAANIVKLCGNFLIAAAIESMSESLTLAQKNGVSRTQFMKLMSDTIFNCLIYKGYGQRTSEFDHTPYINQHFALNLGYKDIKLIKDIAENSNTTMPMCNLLQETYLTAINKNRSHLDWSAIALNIAENSGINTQNIEKKCNEQSTIPK